MLLVEPMWRLYTRSLVGDEISSYIILWCSRLLILHMIYGYHVESFGVIAKSMIYTKTFYMIAIYHV